jgi:hypothetical protein
LLATGVALVLVLGTGTALAARGDPQKELTPADNARARSMLLKRSDLPPGFRGRPAGSDEVDVYCKALDESDLTMTGEAESLRFERAALVSVSSAAQVYATVADASASWRRGTSVAGERCAKETLRREFAKEGVRLVSLRRIAPPKVADRSVAYRIELSAETQGVTVRLVIDWVVLMHSRAHAVLFFGALSPIPRSEQLPLVRLVAQRMEKAMRGA